MRNIKYKQSIITFDIESTSLAIYKPKHHRDGSVTEEVDKKYAWMYICAVYNNGSIFHFRTWDQAKDYFDSLSRICDNNTRYICWVHNLSFEFQFMKDFMKLKEVFCRKAHNVIKCVYKNIEFRDTLALSNCKLANLAKNEHLGIEKLEGDLDYSLVRHQLTDMTEKEIKYLNHDVIIVAKYIEKKVKEYGRLENIPLTSTGEVRRLFVTELEKTSQLDNIHELAVLYSADCMELQNLLIDIYAGAYTHANYQCIGDVLEDLLCKDIASSYPYQMISKKYPTIWYQLDEEKISSEEFLIDYPIEEYAYAMRVRIHGLRRKHVHSIISSHKCQAIYGDRVVDNGRIAYADEVSIAINDIDFLNILDFYDFDDIEFYDVWVSKKEYLPTPLVKIILKLFKDKTSLKGVEEEIDNYMRSKARANGVYGSTVFNIMASGYYFDEVSNMKFLKNEMEFSDFKKYVNNPKQYLWYSIGVWVTSYAKRQILTPIKKMSENAKYCDTDSVKYTSGKRYVKLFEHLNAQVRTEFYDAMKYHGLPKSDYTFMDKFGVEHFIGIFEEEEPYKRFKSLGSKRYLVEYYDGKMSSTVAGAPKDLWKHLGKTNDEKFDNFKDNFRLRDCKLTHTYTEGKTKLYVTDYNGVGTFVDVRSGVCLTKADFTMSLSDEFKNFLNGMIDVENCDIYQYFIGQQRFKK